MAQRGLQRFAVHDDKPVSHNDGYGFKAWLAFHGLYGGGMLRLDQCGISPCASPMELPAGGFAFPEVFNAARRNLGAHLVHFSGREARGIGVVKQEHGRQHKGASLHIGIRHAAFAAVAHPQFAPAFLVVLRAVLVISCTGIPATCFLLCLLRD